LGSRHHSLEMTEVADVRDTLMAFEEHNNVQVELRMGLSVLNGVPDIEMTAIAHQRGVEIGDQPSLASVSVKCSVTNLKHWKDVHTHVLYALDFQLALNEYASAERKKA